MPGTHWHHAHSHGSTALQVGSGNAAAIIVKDPLGYLPSDIANAKDILLVIHYWLRSITESIRDETRDEFLSFGEGTEFDFNKFRTVNGQYKPKLLMKQNEWQRWRLVFSSWLRTPLDLTFDGCEMYLLAKDGVYIRNYPRRIFQAPIPTAGRADVMVRCTEVGSYEVRDWQQSIMEVEVSSSNIPATDLVAWSPEYPAYLSDLRTTSPDDGCSCSTELNGDSSINGIPYNPYVYQHTAKFGSIVERILSGISAHPFHMHVYPFQLIGMRRSDGGVQEDLNSGTNTFQRDYFQVGDWHDVLMIEDIRSPVVTRFPVDVHAGRIFIHCHRLEHEDGGMMAQELVVDDGECACDILFNRTGDLIKITAENTDAILFGP